MSDSDQEGGGQLSGRPDPKRLRSFGLLVGGVFLLIGVWPVVFRADPVRLWAAIVAALLVLPALVLPQSLGPVYRAWMAVGSALGWINTRIILGIIFYGLFTPLGLMRRVMLKRDAMTRDFDPEAETYRVVREPRSPEHLKRQF